MVMLQRVVTVVLAMVVLGTTASSSAQMPDQNRQVTTYWYGDGFSGPSRVMLRPWMMSGPMRSDPETFDRRVRLRRAGLVLAEVGGAGVTVMSATFLLLHLTAKTCAEQPGQTTCYERDGSEWAWGAGVLGGAIMLWAYGSMHRRFEQNQRAARSWLERHDWRLAPVGARNSGGLQARVQW